MMLIVYNKKLGIYFVYDWITLQLIDELYKNDDCLILSTNLAFGRLPYLIL